MNKRFVHEAIGWLTVSLFFLLLTVPLLFATGGDYVWDQDSYHVPAVQQIQTHWPVIDLKTDVLSAVAPGYHWFLAGVSLLLGGADVLTLRTLNLVVSFLVLAVLYRWLCRTLNPIDSAILLTPLTTSNFFIKSSAWVVPDNPGILLPTLVLIGMINPARNRIGGPLGVVAAAAVFVRQINIWLVGPLLLSSSLFVREKRVVTALVWRLLDVACLLSPIVVLGWLYASWGGFVPAKWHSVAFTFSTSGIAYLSVLFLGFSLFFFGGKTLVLAIRCLDRRVLLAACGLGLMIATVSPTTFSYADGRWGGYLWKIVEWVPSVWERSCFFLILAPLGTLAATGVWQLLRSRAGARVANLWGGALLCWAATFLVNRQVFHRYFEPMLLVFLVVAVARTTGGTFGRGQRLRMVVLTIIQICLTLVTTWAKSF